ncbi:hypothetical protein ScPMuIL_007459 [Solemya velum]
MGPRTMRSLLFAASILCLVTTYLFSSSTTSRETAMNDHVFQVVWNIPTSVCKAKYDVDLKLDHYGIIYNKDHAFRGGNVSLFYERDLGLFPLYSKNASLVEINGGLPQTDVGIFQTTGNTWSFIAASRDVVDDENMYVVTKHKMDAANKSDFIVLGPIIKLDCSWPADLDDIVLLASNAEQLQKLLDTVSLWCRKWRLNVNRLNITEHLQKLTSDLDALLPDHRFTGYGVIDWETWRPTYLSNTYTPYRRVYLEQSNILIRKMHPDWAAPRVQEAGRVMFEKAARDLFQTTMLRARQMRPGGVWGFFPFPRCQITQVGIGETDCDARFKADNDRKAWILEVSSAIYPSLYMFPNQSNQLILEADVHNRLKEALRLRRDHADEDLVVMPYCSPTYVDTDVFLPKEKLRESIGEAFDAGTNGVILWDSYHNVNSKDKCVNLKNYLANILGPYILDIKEFADDCSTEMCNGNGKCVKNSYRSFHRRQNTQEANGAPGKKRFNLRHFRRFREYYCLCNSHWRGEYCESYMIPYITDPLMSP